MDQAQTPADPNNLTLLEEKHWPVIEAIRPKIGEKFAVKVSVGKIPHPMEAEHLIMWIEAFYGHIPVGKIYLEPGKKAAAEFTVLGQKPEVFKAYAFCNLHGLWLNEVSFFKSDKE